MLKKTILSFTILIIALSFSGCGNSKSENSDKNSIKSSILKNEQTVIDLEGDNGDKLNITIPKDSVQNQEDDVEFKLVFEEEEKLPRIVINKDISFSNPVNITYTSDTFLEGKKNFIYIASDGKRYSVPAEYNGNIMSATLYHFSEYTWDDYLDEDTLHINITEALDELKTDMNQQGIENISYDRIRGIYSGILNLDALYGTDGADYESKLKKIINDAYQIYIDKLIDMSFVYFNGYEFSDAFLVHLNKVNELPTEFLNMDSLMLRDAMYYSHYNKAVDVFITLNIPSVCDKPNMIKFKEGAISFENKISNSDAFEEEKRNILITKLQDHTKDSFNTIVEGTLLQLDTEKCSCDKDTIKYYNTESQKYFTIYNDDYYIDLSNSLSAKLLLQDGCKECNYLWDIRFTQNGDRNNESGEEIEMSGYANFSKVFIYPRCDYILSADEHEACDGYINWENKLSKDASATNTYLDGSGSVTDPNTVMSFGYAGAKIHSSSLCFRDPEGDNGTPDDQLSKAYLEGTDNEVKDYLVYPGVGVDEGDQYLGAKIKTDIFEEILKRESFSVSEGGASITFTPTK